jgi:hypothetical protein
LVVEEGRKWARLEDGGLGGELLNAMMRSLT